MVEDLCNVPPHHGREFGLTTTVVRNRPSVRYKLLDWNFRKETSGKRSRRTHHGGTERDGGRLSFKLQVSRLMFRTSGLTKGKQNYSTFPSLFDGVREPINLYWSSLCPEIGVLALAARDLVELCLTKGVVKYSRPTNWLRVTEE